MARVHIVFSATEAKSAGGSMLPIPNGAHDGSETVESGAANVVTSLRVPEDRGVYGSFTVTVSGGNVWLAIGRNPDASKVAERWLLLDGETRSFGVSSLHAAAVLSA